MKKIDLVLASVLKPVDDVRMFAKLGISLSETNNYNVNIIGFLTNKIPEHENIKFYPIFSFKRLGWKRFWASWKYYKILLQVKPKIIIVTTHELLIVTCLYKILFGSKILYDVQENYFRNLWYEKNYPPGVKHLMAITIRLIELLTKPFISHYFLAERCYTKELTFTGKKYTILENKFKITRENTAFLKERESFLTSSEGKFTSAYAKAASSNNNPLTFIYSGTIQEKYGIFEAIQFTKIISNLNIQLKIVGYCPNQRDYQRLIKAIEYKPYIKLVGVNTLIPHNELIKEFIDSDIALLPYHLTPSISGRIPTKVYEYAAFGLPMIIQNNSNWQSIDTIFTNSYFIDFKSFNHSNLIQQLKQIKFQASKNQDIFWQSEEEKLIHLMKKINKQT